MSRLATRHGTTTSPARGRPARPRWSAGSGPSRRAAPRAGSAVPGRCAVPGLARQPPGPRRAVSPTRPAAVRRPARRPGIRRGAGSSREAAARPGPRRRRRAAAVPPSSGSAATEPRASPSGRPACGCRAAGAGRRGWCSQRGVDDGPPAGAAAQVGEQRRFDLVPRPAAARAAARRHRIPGVQNPHWLAPCRHERRRPAAGDSPGPARRRWSPSGRPPGAAG